MDDGDTGLLAGADILEDHGLAPEQDLALVALAREGDLKIEGVVVIVRA